MYTSQKLILLLPRSRIALAIFYSVRDRAMALPLLHVHTREVIYN